MRILFAFLFIITSLSGWGFQSLGPSLVAFKDISQKVEFGRQITFSVTIQFQGQLQSLDLFIRQAGGDTRVVPLASQSSGKISTTYNLVEHPLRPFSQVDYWYRASLADGSVYSSNENSFFYEDDRFQWKRLDQDGFAAAWLDGDLEFGQTILNVAQTSWTNVQTFLPAEAPTPLRVYVYTKATDLQSTLQLTNTPWVAGHASPDLGVVLVSIPAGPDQRAELERQIPHELMHIVEYQQAGAAYSRLPMWLVEGLASIAELYPNQDYQRAMQEAIDENRLVPLVNLCSEFPRDLSGAFLAYAESESFVRFLYQNFGGSGMTVLINQYKDGYGCEEGVRAAFTETLPQLETRWKQEFLGLNVSAVAWKNLRPYLFVLLMILIPVAITLFPPRRRKEKNP